MTLPQPSSNQPPNTPRSRQLPGARLSLLAMALVAITGCAALLPAEPSADAPMAVREPVLDELLKPQQRGYLGADGAASIVLSEGRVLWVLGDTILGTAFTGERKGGMVRNSIAIQDMRESFPGEVTYHWNLEDNITGDFFPTESWEDPHWFWPGSGIHHEGQVYLFLTKLIDGSGPDGFAFETVDCTLFRIRNPQDEPDQWQMEQVDLGFGNQHFNINVAAMVEDDHVYLIGYHDGPDNQPGERAAILSRMPIEALEAEQPGSYVEFWSEDDTWRPQPDRLQPLFRPGTTESGIAFNPVLQRYVTFTQRPFQPDLLMTTAESLTGPWSEPRKVFHIDEVADDDNYHAYAPRLHPMLSDDPRRLIVTYVVNTRDFWTMFEDLDIYYPRFLVIEVEP